MFPSSFKSSTASRTYLSKRVSYCIHFESTYFSVSANFYIHIKSRLSPAYQGKSSSLHRITPLYLLVYFKMYSTKLAIILSLFFLNSMSGLAQVPPKTDFLFTAHINIAKPLNPIPVPGGVTFGEFFPLLIYTLIASPHVLRLSSFTSPLQRKLTT
jgi:hypothetical protein